jgi:hypothetical protein
MRDLMQQKLDQENRQIMAAVRIGIQEALGRLLFCPICGDPLETYVGTEMSRTCHCGEFTIAAVHTDGDVEYTYMAINPEEVEPRAAPDDTGETATAE